jgi:pyruvate-ferredoxin/flavodoxin oxidoreductase
VTKTSLPVGEALQTTGYPEGTVQCKFWGLGSDGTVWRQQERHQDHGDTPRHDRPKGYFAYDSKKSRAASPCPTCVSASIPSSPPIW